MRCPDAQALLEAYVDNVLAPAQREAVDAHVAACAACREELAGWQQALGGLAALAPAAAPDLWSRFQERVRVEQAPLACSEALELLPGLNDARLTPREATDLAGHLAACAPCREEEHRLGEAVRLLEAVAASTAAPDLWPEFVSRLERERAARPVWAGWLEAVRRSIAAPRAAWLGPALALGGAALAAFVLFGRPTSRPFVKSVQNVGPSVTAPSPTKPILPKRLTKRPPDSGLSRDVRTADASIIHHGPRFATHRRGRRGGSHLVRVARQVTPAGHPRPAPASTRVALDPGFGGVEGAGSARWQAGTVPADAGTVKEAAQAEVVHAVEMLASLEDTARRPFEMIEDGH